MAATLLAAETKADFYLSAAAGGDRSPSMLLVSGDDDRASRCDEFINPRYAELPVCTAPDRTPDAADSWSSQFDSAWGSRGGAAVGYRFRERFRVELEVDYGRVDLDTSSPIIAPSGVAYDIVAAPELADAYERIDRIELLGLFANVLGAAHVTAGVGYALTERLSLEIRARHVWSAGFGDEGSYITLRGHPSELRIDGSEPVRWHVGTEDTERFRVGLRLNYSL